MFVTWRQNRILFWQKSNRSFENWISVGPSQKKFCFQKTSREKKISSYNFPFQTITIMSKFHVYLRPLSLQQDVTKLRQEMTPISKICHGSDAKEVLLELLKEKEPLANEKQLLTLVQPEEMNNCKWVAFIEPDCKDGLHGSLAEVTHVDRGWWYASPQYASHQHKLLFDIEPLDEKTPDHKTPEIETVTIPATPATPTELHEHIESILKRLDGDGLDRSLRENLGHFSRLLESKETHTNEFLIRRNRVLKFGRGELSKAPTSSPVAEQLGPLLEKIIQAFPETLVE